MIKYRVDLNTNNNNLGLDNLSILCSYPCSTDSFFFLSNTVENRFSISYSTETINLSHAIKEHYWPNQYIIITETFSLIQRQPLIPDLNGMIISKKIPEKLIAPLLNKNEPDPIYDREFHYSSI